MWNAWLDESQAGIKIAGKNFSNLRYADDTTINGRKWRGTKSLLMRVEKSEKSGLNLNIYKTDMASGPIMCECMLSHFSHVWLSAALWTVVHQASLSMGFSRQEYQSKLKCPPPGDLPKLGTEPVSACISCITERLFTHLGSPWFQDFMTNIRGKNGSNGRFYFLGLQNYCGQRLQPLN